MAEDYSHMSPKSYELPQDRNESKLHFQEAQPPRKMKKPRPFRDSVREFMAETSLHGFKYWTDDRSWIERLWWIVMTVCSIVVCAIFIRKVWIKWDETPVIVSFAETSNSVWHIPFPAITICSETKPRQRVFNFTKAHFERWTNPPKISAEDLKTYHDMLLLCNNDASDGPDFAGVSSIETLQRLAPTREELFMACLWDNLTCDQMFFHTLTKDGYCFTFNMLSAEEMFRTENLHKDYYHVAGHNRSAWTLQQGYPHEATINTYPLRGPSYGGVEFEVILLTDIRDLDQVCRGPVQGFKIWLHNPAELPNMGQNFFRLPIQYQSAAAITPRVMDTSEGLRHYLPQKRQCYFPEERYLRFFRTYTQRNCQLECSSNHTALRCDCVPLYMPHGPETKVCGGGKKSCIIDALEELSLSKSSLQPESKGEVRDCDCLQACTELKYDAEVSQAVYDLTTYRRNPDPDIAQGRRLPSGLVVYFAEELFTSLRRSELYGGVDFLANCGGIMGLFMGFSFLSLIEIIYYFTMRTPLLLICGDGTHSLMDATPACSSVMREALQTICRWIQDSNILYSVRHVHEISKERAGVAMLREVLEERLQVIKKAKTWKHERVISSPQDRKVTVEGMKGEFLNFCANNYLGLANHPEVVEAAREALCKYGAGLSSVRFICGTQTLHKKLENRISQFHGREDTILYGSCFDANAGLFESMLSSEDAVFSDALNHASIIDGVRLCKAQRFRYPHRDLKELEHLLAHSNARIKLIVTDGVFSMDGTVAPLEGLRELADRYRALLAVDDSHATGFFGETGRGTEEYCGMLGGADIICSTLGKAVSGSAGGYTTGPKELVTLLRNVSRPYLFSNAPPPPVIAASLKALDLIEHSTELRQRLRENTRSFRQRMKAAGLTVAGDDHPICPVMVGEAPLAVDLASGMLERGIYVVAFSYPVVPKGKARVRVQLSAAHTPEDVDKAVAAFVEVGKCIGLVKA